MKILKKYKNLILFIILLVLIFGGKKVWQMYKTANPKVDYEIVKLSKRDLKKSISIDGEVTTDYEISLASEIPGIISKVYVKEGQYVKKGKLLMKLKDTDYRNQIDSAYANQKISEVAYQKTKNPNHNLKLDEEIIEDNKEAILVNIEKVKKDIKNEIDDLEINLSQILRMEIDDYFDHTEYDDGYNANPVFKYRLRPENKIKELENQRKIVGEYFGRYKESKKTLENSLLILNKFEELSFNLYMSSRDFLGMTEVEREQKENSLAGMRKKIVGYRKILENLRTELINLEKQVDTKEKTKKKVVNTVNPVDLKLAKERIRQAKIQTKNAYTQLQKTNIKAPKSGVIVEIFKDEGEYAGPSIPLLKLNSTVKYIEAYVPEVDIAKIEKGRKVKIKLDAYKDKEFDGVIDLIYPDKKEIFGVTYYKLKILFDLKNKNYQKVNILPGMSAEVEIIYDKKNNVLAVKRGIAKKDENDDYYFEILNKEKKLPKDPQFLKKYIKIGFIGDNYIEVLDQDLDKFDIVKIIKKK